MDIKNRQKYNQDILEHLKEYIDKHPEIRFIQALWNCGLINRESVVLMNENPEISFRIEDRFFEEPLVTLEKVKKELSKN